MKNDVRHQNIEGTLIEDSKVYNMLLQVSCAQQAKIKPSHALKREVYMSTYFYNYGSKSSPKFKTKTDS